MVWLQSILHTIWKDFSGPRKTNAPLSPNKSWSIWTIKTHDDNDDDNDDDDNDDDDDDDNNINNNDNEDDDGNNDNDNDNNNNNNLAKDNIEGKFLLEDDELSSWVWVILRRP